MNQEELESILGGAPRAAVQEFQKPGELTEEELMGVLAGGERQVMVEKQLENAGVFRQTSVDAEKQAMFQELEQQRQPEESSNTHSM